jgi:hypothetical protein
MFLVVSIISVIVAGAALAATERFAARLTGARRSRR